MTAKEFIVKELKNLIIQFPQVRVRYEFHKLVNAHFVEIVPYRLYHSNDDFFLWEYETWNRYVDLYPKEGLCFISDDALVSVKNAELTLYGADYVRKHINKERIVETVAMTSKEFIVKELKNLVERFPEVRVRYEFNELANAHFVEVVPYKVYKSNSEYILWESELWDRYVELYPEEGLCFISDNDVLVSIEKAEMRLYGADYFQKHKKRNKKSVV
jgi:hypothetical protein